ncbi:MAG: M13 family metallopeptidase, partial [Planctomycetota bacterium]
MRPSLFVVAALVLGACSSSDRKEPEQHERPALRSGFDPATFDKAVRPQDDLYRAVNGGWITKTEIPRDRPALGAFSLLQDKTELDLRAIIDDAAKGTNTAGSNMQKVGDLYLAYMDEARADELGLKPIAKDLEAIEAIATKADLAKQLAALQKIGVGGAFEVWVSQDAKNSERYILQLNQPNLGLPDREYYLSAKHREKLEAYSPHLAKVLALSGLKDTEASAAEIVALETLLAGAEWSREECRDDTKTYNKLTRAELQKLAPAFEWAVWLEAMGVKDQTEVVVSQPSYFAGLSKILEEMPLASWKAWLRARTLHQFADVLGKELSDTEFAFYGTKLNGVPEQRPRWKRAIGSVRHHLGFALGELYVKKHFPPEAKARMEQLVANLIKAYAVRIEGLSWMSPETRKKALAKLAAFSPKIGYPKKWRDYSKLSIDKADLAGDLRRASIFEYERNLAKLGGPVDRDEWWMTPQQVNAYYDSNKNEIVFPAAILQPPFFDLGADDAVNYGGIGAVIGHEIGHGFDDQGSKWDGAGNLVDWWTPADRAEFDRRGGALVAQYDRFEPLAGSKVNGRLTLGENIGDLAGCTVAHAAYKMSLGGK